MFRDPRLLAGIVLLGAAVAACSGGASSVVPQGNGGGQGTQPALNRTVTFKVMIPGVPASQGIRHSRDTVYVSPNTASIGIQLSTVDGKALLQAAPASVGNVSRTCIGSRSGCTVTIANVKAAVGNDGFAVTTYTAPDGGGSIISQGIVPVTVDADANATVGGTTLSIGGFVASIGLTVDPPQFYIGEASDSDVFVVAKDASGATIVGNTRFAVPITIAASPSPQFQLIFGDAQGVSVTLAGPENAHSIVKLRYNGSTQVSSAVVTASSRDSSNDPISASDNVAVIPAPSPTPSGPPPPNDVYVLNGADNSVNEYVAGSSQFAERRAFGGNALGCTPQLQGALNVSQVLLGSSGLAFDGGRNALAGSGYTCGKPGAVERFYAFAPSAVATATPSAVYASKNQNVLTFVGFAYDPTLQYLDVSDASINTYLYEYRLSGNQATQVAALGQTSGAPTCFLAPGAAQCGSGSIAPGTFITEIINGDTEHQPGETFALDGQGLGYYPVINTSLFNFNIIRLPMIDEPPSGPALARSVWIAGITPYSQNYGPQDANRLDNYPLGMAIDGNMLYVLNFPTNQRLFVGSKEYVPYYPPAAICDTNPNATPSPGPSLCADGRTHEFLSAYDLSQLTGSGPVNLRPVLVVGGDNWPGGNAAGAAFANRVAAGGGNVYVAQPVGAQCNASCFGNLGQSPIGRIAVYSESLRGVHINDGSSAPATTIEGTSIKFPTGVTLGPQGTGQGGFARRRR